MPRKTMRLRTLVRHWNEQPFSLLRHQRFPRCSSVYGFARWISSSKPTNSSSSNNKDGYESLRQRLTDQYKIDSHLHDGIFQALSSVYGKDLSTSHLDSFGKEGLLALASSVEQQQQQDGDNAAVEMATVTISVPHHRTEFTVDWPVGKTFLQVSENHEVLREYIEATCGGTMACCTCHVRLDPQSFATLEPPSQAENDMLDLAYELDEDSSRLGCQIQMTHEWSQQQQNDKIVVTIPSGVNNVYS